MFLYCNQKINSKAICATFKAQLLWIIVRDLREKEEYYVSLNCLTLKEVFPNLNQQSSKYLVSLDRVLQMIFECVF